MLGIILKSSVWWRRDIATLTLNKNTQKKEIQKNLRLYLNSSIDKLSKFSLLILAVIWLIYRQFGEMTLFNHYGLSSKSFGISVIHSITQYRKHVINFINFLVLKNQCKEHMFYYTNF